MKLTDVNIMYAKYKMSNMTITIPGLSTPHKVAPENIISIVIEKDFDNYMFPYFEVDVLVPNYIHRTMKKNNQMIQAYIDLQYGWFKTIDYTSDDIPPFSSYVTDNFYVFMDDMTPEEAEAFIEAKEKENNTYGHGMDLGDFTLVRLLLYKEDYLFKSKTVVNNVLSSATLVEALTFVLNKAGLSKVLISPPSNYKSYSEFVLTPITAMEQMDRICNSFGLHSNGTMIFFDFKALFILDKCAKNTAYVKNEYKTTYILSCPTTAQTSTMLRGCYFNPTERYSLLNLDPSTLSMRSMSVVNDQLYGNDFINIDTKSGNVSSISSGASKASGSLSSPTRVLVSRDGDNTLGALRQSMSEESKIISMGFSYINLNMLDPNKEFVFSIEDTRFAKYSGKLRISKATILFQKEGDFFAPHVVAEFRGK